MGARSRIHLSTTQNEENDMDELTTTPDAPSATEPTEAVTRLRAVLPKSAYKLLQHASVESERSVNDLLVEAVERFVGVRS
jgi:hypothetical protein